MNIYSNTPLYIKQQEKRERTDHNDALNILRYYLHATLRTNNKFWMYCILLQKKKKKKKKKKRKKKKNKNK